MFSTNGLVETVVASAGFSIISRPSPPYNNVQILISKHMISWLVIKTLGCVSILENEKNYSVHGVCTDRQECHFVKAKSSVFEKSACITANEEFECQFVKPRSYAFLRGERAFLTTDTELSATSWNLKCMFRRVRSLRPAVHGIWVSVPGTAKTFKWTNLWKLVRK